MNPSDALPEDYRMYYSDCWMQHKKLGVGLVQIVGTSMYFYTYPEDKPEAESTRIAGRDLTCWWPRAGAYNTSNGAVYIARRATRTMRKSACNGEHYQITWGRNPRNVMLTLRKGPEFIEYEFAKKVINKGFTRSVALTRDIIINNSPNEADLQVIFRGHLVGKMQKGTFVPNNPRSAMARRTMSKLSMEGII